jgi:hypothetical protein
MLSRTCLPAGKLKSDEKCDATDDDSSNAVDFINFSSNSLGADNFKPQTSNIQTYAFTTFTIKIYNK